MSWIIMSIASAAVDSSRIEPKGAAGNRVAGNGNRSIHEVICRRCVGYNCPTRSGRFGSDISGKSKNRRGGILNRHGEGSRQSGIASMIGCIASYRGSAQNELRAGSRLASSRTRTIHGIGSSRSSITNQCSQRSSGFGANRIMCSNQRSSVIPNRHIETGRSCIASCISGRASHRGSVQSEDATRDW